MNRSQLLKNAAVVGIVPAILEGMLVYSVEPSIDHWILLQGLLFWFTCGFTIHVVELNIPRVFLGVIFTVFLNLPWYIAESIVKNKPEHFLPLVVASIVFGAVIGWISKKLRNRTSA